MLKMLIVEDEKWEREGLLDFLDWKRFGITTVETAFDGIDGLNKAKELHPDIIITDIKMPGLDGIGMSKKLKEIMPNVKVILLTGYDDFRLAKEAISFNANAYVLKPLDEEELIPVIRKAVDECRKEIKKAEKENLINSLLSESLNIAKDKFISDILEGNAEHQDYLKLFSQYGLKVISDSKYIAAVAKLSEKDNRDEKEPLLKQLLSAFEKKFESCLVFSVIDHIGFQLKICLSFKDNSAELSTLRKGIEDLIGEKNGVSICVGLGNPVDSLDNISNSYHQALQSVEFGIFRSRTGITDFKYTEELQRGFNEHSGDFLVKSSYFSKQLIHALRSSNEERLFALIDEMFELIEENLGASRDFTANYLKNIFNETSIFLYTLNVGFDQGSIGEMSKELFNMTELKAMKAFTHGFFTGTLNGIMNTKTNKDVQIVKKVTYLIEERYMQDINLKTIARDVFLSPNYLGSIFKKCTGKTFNDYLCEYRMEKAKELLSSPKNKVSTVASKVGIPNTSYFCTIFRETFGMAPGEYQETLLRSK